MSGERFSPRRDGELWITEARRRGASTALAGSRTLSYGELGAEADRAAGALCARLGGGADLGEARVAALLGGDVDWVVAEWAVWGAGGIYVPLCVDHPVPELAYVIEDSGATALVYEECFAERAIEVARRTGCLALPISALAEANAAAPALELRPERGALIVYTSGTTGRPKGVVATHGSVEAQIRSLVTAWGWRPGDRTLNVLPLHHVHGIVNVVACALWSGAVCEMMRRFDAERVWERLASGELSVFMAVPTIYAKLLESWRRADADRRRAWSEGAAQLRLMVSGSAALPERVLSEWERVTGHRLLERYGMSETGMILSNPLDGERRAGFVGTPLPGVEVRFVVGGEEAEGARRGELEVRGPGLFREYWGRPEETQAAFVGGWFRTGDVAELRDGSYRMLGRTSVDILKTGGYKVSALEIEECLREHPAIAECAVVGVADEEWGQRVAVAIEATPGAEALELESLRAWAKERLAPYKVPTLMRIVEQLPRNALGKVTKPAVAALFS